MSERTARLLLGGLCAALVGGLASVDLAALTGGRFWSDGATYYSMAWSLVEDGDLRYEAKDVLRARREFAAGPQGIFLKRASGGLAVETGRGFPYLRRVGAHEPRVYFAKALTYPLLAAPFVGLLGTRGLLVLNGLAFSLCLWLAYAGLRRRSGPGAALGLAIALFLAGVAPVYLLWPQPEIVGAALATGALAAWSGGRPRLCAVLLGIAIYTKPTNLFLALPLGVAPLFEARPRWAEAVRRGLLVCAVAAALYGVNAAVTGEINYQGGERKTFYGRFPFETPEVSFGNSGFWMTTERLGPDVEGDTEGAPARGSGPPLAEAELRGALLANLGYFWIGRHGGAIAYFFPVVLAAVLFLAAGPRDPPGWLALASLLVSYVFYVWMIPANWYGGGGTLGNRYFINLVPLSLYLVPRGREALLAAASPLVAAAFLGPVWLAPLSHSLKPSQHTLLPSFRALPAELTMLNDLSFCTDAWRRRRPVGDTEGDAHRHWPPDPKAYWLYFPDDGTWGKETHAGNEGFWLRGGARAEVILRALEPVRAMRVRVTGGAAGDRVTLRLAGAERLLTAAAGGSDEWRVETAPGFPYYDSFLHVLELSSRADPPPEPDGRRRGAFVQVLLEVERRPRPRP